MSAKVCADLSLLEVAPLNGPDCGIWRLVLHNPGISGIRAGQFAMLRPLDWQFEPLWARPFSISSFDAHTLTFYIQAVGRGSAKICALNPGDKLKFWGPLGHWFEVRPEAKTLLLAGGMGIAPFVGYARTHPQPENLEFFFGHRLPLESYPYRQLKTLTQAEAFIEKSPEDLQRFVARLGLKISDYAANGLILACGPLPFLRTVKRICEEKACRAQLSLETRMACGVGACLGCVCKDDTGWPVQVCQRGPVFWSNEISLED